MRISALVLTASAAVAGLTATTAAFAKEVNLYSYRQEKLIRPILDEFEKETGIEVNVVFAKKGMLQRLKSEGMNSPADAILTVDISRLMSHKQAGVLQAIASYEISKNIPAQYRDPKGFWYGLTVRSRVLFYAKDRVKASDLSTYEDLADPKWKGRICVRSSTNVYNQSMLAAMVAHKGSDAAEKWAAGIKENLARKPQGGDRDQIKAAAAGECDVAIGNTYYYGKMQNSSDAVQADAAKKVAMFWPNQNDRGSHVNISGVAVTKAAKNKENAIKLIEFLSNDKAQKFYASSNYEYPVKAGVEINGTVASWGTHKFDAIGLDKVADQQVEAVKIFDRVGWR
ncbi:Fe(3+) ABC transporter substrate-binding protein [Alphaproteobacteria bacterium 46_93_T64]|nr:Fe(3+) ABC transporter substrate-binding protein [Alphaproteobacteria bacterium 46_93_T64]